jgi:carbonic anhydrase/acetyltransferase-like protein (isoleucine patch superfamily)
VVVGEHCQVNIGAALSHDVHLVSLLTIGAGANLSGRVRLGDGVFVGVGASISNDVTLASGVVVGAGATVLADVMTPNAVVHPQHLRRAANGGEHRFSSSATRRSAVINLSTRCSRETLVCSSIIDAILIALPSTVESNWKSIAQTTFGASASMGGIDDTPARFRGPCTRSCSPSSRHERWTFSLLTSQRSS